VKGLLAEGIEYIGFIFFGLIKVGDDPFVIEYNCRLGDPETESMIPRLKNDLVQLFKSVADRTLHTETISVDPRAAVSVMLVSKGYPEAYEKGKVITGEDQVTNSLVFHAGTKTDAATGSVMTNGGRVMAVTALATTMEQALKKSYEDASKLNYDGKNFRTDIGFDLS
jgi:phosphoribosylamine--glycine ligase